MASEVPISQRTSRWLSFAIIAVGLGWLGWLIAREASDALDAAQGIEPGWLTLTLMLGTLSMLAGARSFHHALAAHAGVSQPFRYVCYVLFVGQIARHLPGRVWGIVAQLSEARERIDPSALVQANVDYLILSSGIGLVTSMVILLYLDAAPAGAVIMLFAGLLGVTALIQGRWSGRIVALAGRLLPLRFRPLVDRLSLNQPHPLKVLGLIVGWMALSWLLYLGTWHLLGKAMPALEGVNMWRLCAYYTLSWAVGYFTLLTPGGLGIREAVFVLLSGTATTEGLLAVLAVVVRLLLLVIELALFLVLVPVGLRSRK